MAAPVHSNEQLLVVHSSRFFRSLLLSRPFLSFLPTPTTMQQLLLTAAIAAYIPALAQGCADHAPRVYARQLSSSASASTSLTTAVPSSGVSSGSISSTAVSASGNASTTLPPQVSVSLISQNPTAVPLSSIIAGESSSATIALPTTFTAGAIPSGIDNAPALPACVYTFSFSSPLFVFSFSVFPVSRAISVWCSYLYGG